LGRLLAECGTGITLPAPPSPSHPPVRQVLAECGTSIKDIYHNRSTPDTDISSVRVTCVVETADRENAQRMHDTLVEHGCVPARRPA
jgi:hypothetical protein